MKIKTIELKEIEVVEVNGEFEKRYINVKKYPLFLTNSALRRGRDLGLTDTSLMGEIASLQSLSGIDIQAVNSGDGMDAIEQLAEIDEQRLITVIYLAFIGANKSVKIDFDEFMELYHLDFMETFTLYGELISATISNDNNFAKGFQASTAGNKKK